MLPLNKDLQSQKENIEEFKNLTIRILDYLPNVLSSHADKHEYRIFESKIAGTSKFIRPINTKLFLFNSDEFRIKFDEFCDILRALKEKNQLGSNENRQLINSVTYTIQQAMGAGFDVLVNPNSARKHVGNRFEELIRAIFKEIEIPSKRVVLQIPYQTDEGIRNYKCENDLILTPFKKVLSNNKNLNEKELVISVKTTSKDRMSKMFIDKLLLEKFIGHKQKFIGIFLNDVQRKKSDNISFTLVSGLFMVYTKFLVELEGIYYVDPPPNANKAPFNNHMKTFGDLLVDDIWELLTP